MLARTASAPPRRTAGSGRAGDLVELVLGYAGDNTSGIQSARLRRARFSTRSPVAVSDMRTTLAIAIAARNQAARKGLTARRRKDLSNIATAS